MFEQTFVQTQVQTRRPWTVVASLSLQCGVVGIVLLIPLLHTEALLMPEAPKSVIFRAIITQPPLPVTAVERTVTVSPVTAPRTVPVFAPTSHVSPGPPRIEVPATDIEGSAWNSLSVTSFGPTITGNGPPLPPAVREKSPAAPSLVKTPTAPTGPIRISSGVEGARLLFGPHPAYPSIAKAARSQGTVRLEAVIGTDGSVRDLRVVSGPPLLVTAAVDAVKQWRYQPTMLNGSAVEVLTDIDINFTLGQ